MDDLHTETSADAPLVADWSRRPGAAGSPRRHRHRRARPSHRVAGAAGSLPIAPRCRSCCWWSSSIAWAVDTSSGGGRPQRRSSPASTIGGLTEDELAGRVGDVAADFAATPVELARRRRRPTRRRPARSASWSTRTRPTASALDVGDDAFLLARPFAWAGRSSRARRAAAAPGERRAGGHAGRRRSRATTGRRPPSPRSSSSTAPSRSSPAWTAPASTRPTWPRAFPGAAEAAMADGADVIRLELSTGPIPPLGSEDAAEDAAAERRGARERAGGDPHDRAASRTITAEQLRTWVRLASNPDGTVVVDLDDGRWPRGLRRRVRRRRRPPRRRQLHPRGRRAGDPPRPARQGVLRRRLRRRDPRRPAGGTRTVAELDARRWAGAVHRGRRRGLRHQAGGGRQQRLAQRRTHHGRPGFTTYHDRRRRPGHQHPPHRRPRPRRRDRTRRELLDQRLRRRAHRREGLRRRPAPSATASTSTEIGGGVSQFATTMFNAAYFAGLDIDESQAHSEYFDRYPRGREATMGFPEPDLRFTNNTPVRDHDLDVVHATPASPSRSTPRPTPRPSRRPSPRRSRATARSSRPPARSPTRTARPRPTSSAPPTVLVRGSAAEAMSDELQYESRMSDSDALMWTIEKDPLLRSTITAVSLLDGPVDARALRATRSTAPAA